LSVPVVNGTFDTDLSGWTPSGTVIQFSAAGNPGGSAQFTGNADGGNYFPSLSQVVGTSVGQTYRLSFDFAQDSQVDSPTQDNVTVRFGSLFFNVPIDFGVTPFTTFSFTGITPSAGLSTTLTFGSILFLHSGSSFLLDNVSVTAEDAPELNVGVATVPFSLIAGLLALTSGRRRRQPNFV